MNTPLDPASLSTHSTSSALDQTDPILRELDGLRGCEDLEGFEDDDHPDEVEIEFPREVAMLHHISGVTVSVHQLLTWMAADEPFMAESLLAIRDDFYSREEDGGWEVGEQFQIYSREELARLRVTRRKMKLQREAAKERKKEAMSRWRAARGVKDETSCTAVQGPKNSLKQLYGEDLAEGIALEAELATHRMWRAQLDCKWEEYFESADCDSGPGDSRLDRLRLEERELAVEFDALMERVNVLEYHRRAETDENPKDAQ
ncbi:hypothetical protein GRZ55_22505 [Chelativorans sp. ZYF759]|uniref:hypothetical protein n=1 Tax=Chelativorans sp. ZYF759 TaxID=2692213 RepID=UPI00145E061B|nr:hypothetical protein [Chelativorans sp. ZYF759]NMG42004.1 hypothetical protein [Chelativorans sp. ZYF759]